MKKVLPGILIGALVLGVILCLLFVKIEVTDLKDDAKTSNEDVVSVESASEGKISENSVSGENVSSPKKITKFVNMVKGNNYYLKYKSEVEGEEIIVETTVKGDNIAANFEGMGSGIIVKDGYTYTLMNDQKQYTKEIEENSTNVMSAEEYEKYDESKVSVGKEELDGKMYDYEEYDGVRFYFLGDDLKYMKSEEELLEVLEMSDKTKDSLFEIPKGYKEVSFN